MPTLPITQPVSLWAPSPTAQSADDVLAIMPEKYRQEDQPVTQALASALAAHTSAHNKAVEYAAAQSDLLRATDKYLDGKAQDHGFVRALDESDEDFRARVLAWRNIATRDAVAEAVNAVVETYSTSEAVLIDPILDGWYVDDGSAVWSSHVWDESGGSWQNYPDQLYASRTNAGLLDAIPLSSDRGRCFGILIPVIDNVADLMWIDDNEGCFVGDGSESVPMSFTSAWMKTATEVADDLLNAVESVRAHGVRWFALEDARL